MVQTLPHSCWCVRQCCKRARANEENTPLRYRVAHQQHLHRVGAAAAAAGNSGGSGSGMSSSSGNRWWRIRYSGAHVALAGGIAVGDLEGHGAMRVPRLAQPTSTLGSRSAHSQHTHERRAVPRCPPPQAHLLAP